MKEGKPSMTNCEKLPTRIEWSLFGGNWGAYKEALYKIFKKDFVDGQVFFHGKPVDIIHESFFEGKERSFWHIISVGEEDINRNPNAERCANIRWVKPLIEEMDPCENYKHWIKYCDKTKRDRYYVWCSAVNYMVILEDRDVYYKLITAYNVESYNVKKYQNDYERYIKTKTPTNLVDEISAHPTQG